MNFYLAFPDAGVVEVNLSTTICKETRMPAERQVNELFAHCGISLVHPPLSHLADEPVHDTDPGLILIINISPWVSGSSQMIFTP